MVWAADQEKVIEASDDGVGQSAWAGTAIDVKLGPGVAVVGGVVHGGVVAGGVVAGGAVVGGVVAGGVVAGGPSSAPW